MTESRLSRKLQAANREDRSREDTVRAPADAKFASSQERRRAWSEEWTQSALPKLPDIDGWHFCWLSTTNTYDSIDKRMRLGYVPVKADELPGYDTYRIKSGEHAGFISCNEMMLYKLPMEVYQDVMALLHFDRPHDEAEKVRIKLEDLQGQRDSAGKALLRKEGDGLDNISKHPTQAPVFPG